jgi:hypothetical protein
MEEEFSLIPSGVGDWSKGWLHPKTKQAYKAFDDKNFQEPTNEKMRIAGWI